jgi:hypothetical protein
MSAVDSLGDVVLRNVDDTSNYVPWKKATPRGVENYNGPLNGCDHHCATNKSWKENLEGADQSISDGFKELFDEAGVDMNASINNVILPGHKGVKHSKAYHPEVLNRLNRANSRENR